MTPNTKISILMGIYNCAPTLPAAIDSILAQTYTDWELILCDDCSTDDTYAVAQNYAEQYPEKIILLRNDQNRRLAYSLNQCLARATGYYIARMDGDDISAPDRFEKQLAYLQSHPDLQLVGTAMQQFNDTDGNIRVIPQKERVDSKYALRTGVPFHHATILTYKSVFDALGGYTVAKRTSRCEDADLWFRFFAAGYIGGSMPDVLYFVREDENAIRRRTFVSRWRAYDTTRMGFKLLGFPKRWLVKEFFLTLAKSLTPYRAQYWYRKYQQKKG